MPDYGGANDGRCEWSFEPLAARCQVMVVTTMTSPKGGWTYAYCGKHAEHTKEQGWKPTPVEESA